MANTPTSSDSGARKRSIEEMEANADPILQPKLNDENEDILSPAATITSIEELNNPLMSSATKERQASPAPSTLTSISVNTLSGPPPASGPVGVAPPAKRRKLTVEEKAELARAKEERRQQKEHEKQVKAEETRKKNEEREEKKRQREIEKQQKEQAVREKKRQKELVHKAKEEAATKKERQQPRLTTFFKAGGASPAKPKSSPPDTARDRSMSVGTVDSVLGSPTKSPAPAASEPAPKAEPSQYSKHFLPYSLPANTTLPPKDTGVECRIKLHDSDVFMQEPGDIPLKLTDYTNQHKVKRGLSTKSLTTLFAELNAHPQDAEIVKKDISSHAIKYLHFHEDVRPPYCGTWTKEFSKDNAYAVARNPCKRIIEVLNYNYDSEAEWNEEAEEGEDINSDGEDDVDGDDAADDMDGFLDNEDDTPNKSLIPKDSVKWAGLMFEDITGVAPVAAAAVIQEDLMSYQTGCLIPERMRSAHHLAVKPNSMVYWGGPDSLGSWSSRTFPGRTPLSTKFDSLGNKQNSTGQAMKPTKPKPQPKTAKQVASNMIAGRDLELLKAAIVGRTETKADLIPYVQQRFPTWKYPKLAISTTISAVATRHGQLKEWILLQMPNEVLANIQPAMNGISRLE